MENNLNGYFENNQREFTYKEYKNRHIENQQAIQSLFNGSTFINCDINYCDFSRCDFDGVKFSNTSIQHTIFNNTDMKSVYWYNCTFTKCGFTDSYIDNNYFSNCSFESCVFSKAAVLNNEFHGNCFIRSNLQGSMFTLNKFIETSFSQMKLGDCSFYKQIMYKCKYHNVAMNADSLGQIYGLTPNDIEKINYVFLGKGLGNLNKENYQILEDAFEKKQWFFQRIFLEHNINRICDFTLIISIANYLYDSVKNNKVLNSDDVHFFYFVIEFLAEQQHLPLFALIYAYQKLYLTMSSMDTAKFQNKIIKELLINLQYTVHERIEYFASETKCFDSDEYIEIEIHYENKNDYIINFANLFNEYNQLMGIQSINPAKLLKTEKGSIIEYIGITLACIFSFQLVIYGINGILIQAIQLKSNIKLLKSKKPPKKILDLSKKGQQIQPDFIDLISKLNTDVISSLSKLAEKIKNIHFK